MSVSTAAGFPVFDDRCLRKEMVFERASPNPTYALTAGVTFLVGIYERGLEEVEIPPCVARFWKFKCSFRAIPPLAQYDMELSRRLSI